MTGAKPVAGDVRNHGHQARSGASQVKYLEKEFKKNHELQDVQLKKGILVLAGIFGLWL